MCFSAGLEVWPYVDGQVANSPAGFGIPADVLEHGPQDLEQQEVGIGQLAAL